MRARSGRLPAALAAAAVCLPLAGCFPRYVIPEEFDRQADRTVGFSQLERDPERHRGAVVVLGGAVLGARLLQQGTQIEVLHLPLDYYDRPSGPLEASEGRFLVLDPERRDPATLLNRRVTVVGEVVGARVQAVDEIEYTFPSLAARFIHVWGGAIGYGYRYDGTNYDQAPYVYPYPYPYPYAWGSPFYPYVSVDPYPYWYGPAWYYGPREHQVPPPARRRFEAPDNHPPPTPSAPPAPPPRPGPGMGYQRRF